MARESKVVLCSHGAGIWDGGTGGRLVGSWWRSEIFWALILDVGGEGWGGILSSSWESAVVLGLDVATGKSRTTGTEGMGGLISEALTVMILGWLSLLFCVETRAGRPDGECGDGR